jgi:hypothetical protein
MAGAAAATAAGGVSETGAGAGGAAAESASGVGVATGVVGDAFFESPALVGADDNLMTGRLELPFAGAALGAVAELGLVTGETATAARR